MADFSDYNLAALARGETIQIRPRGNSMAPRIKDRSLCTIAPVTDFDTEVKVDDVVLAQLGRRRYLHLVNAVQGDRVQIANNHGRVNGWTNKKNVFGRLVKVEP